MYFKHFKHCINIIFIMKIVLLSICGNSVTYSRHFVISSINVFIPFMYNKSSSEIEFPIAISIKKTRSINSFRLASISKSQIYKSINEEHRNENEETPLAAVDGGGAASAPFDLLGPSGGQMTATLRLIGKAYLHSTFVRATVNTIKLPTNDSSPVSERKLP